MPASFVALALLAASPAGPVADRDCAAVGLGDERQTFIVADDTRLAYVRCGSGAPTVVFEGGFAGNLQNWQTLFPMVGRFAPVFAYSRPGFGRSDPAWSGDDDGKRTSEEAARLLRSALREAKVRPPYVLVGHSLGGLYIQKFAQLYPNETAGLVLMDNRPATLLRDCRATVRLPTCLDIGEAPDWPPVLKATFRGIEASEASAPSPRQLRRIPVLVLTAGTPEEGVDPRYFELFKEQQTSFAGQLEKGAQVILPQATHSSLGSAYAEPVALEIRNFWNKLITRHH